MKNINLKVEEFTTPSPLSVNGIDPIESAYNLMKENNIRHAPVLTEQKLVGVISQRDLTPFINLKAGLTESVNSVMSTDIYTISKEDKIHDVAFEMSSRKIGSAIVLDQGGNVYGIFTTTDALNALVEIVRGELS